MGQQDDAGRGRDGDAAKKTEERRQFRIAPARLALLAWRAGIADLKARIQDMKIKIEYFSTTYY
jgi:hypothetical protein